MIKELSSIEVQLKPKSTIVDITYIDYSENISNRIFDGSFEDTLNYYIPMVFVKSIELKGPYLKELNLKKLAAEYLIETVNEPSNIPKLSRDGLTSRKLSARILSMSSYIASNGRFGPATTIVFNSLMNDIYNITNQIVLGGLELVINDYIPNNTFYILRNDPSEEVPGLKFLYKDNGDDLYYAFTEIGWYGRNQAVKLVLY